MIRSPSAVFFSLKSTTELVVRVCFVSLHIKMYNNNVILSKLWLNIVFVC